MKQKAVIDLAKEWAECERQMQHHTAVRSEAPQTNPYTTPPAVRWAAAAQVQPAAATHSLALSLGGSASNVHKLQQHGGGQACHRRSSSMTMAVRRRMRTKTPPQPVPARKPSIGATKGPDDVTLRLRLSDGHTQISSPYVMEVNRDLSEDRDQDATAYWGSVHEEGSSHVRQEVMTLTPPGRRVFWSRTIIDGQFPVGVSPRPNRGNRVLGFNHVWLG